MTRQDNEGGTTWMCSKSDIDEGDGYYEKEEAGNTQRAYSDFDLHDEIHDTYGNRGEPHDD